MELIKDGVGLARTGRTNEPPTTPLKHLGANADLSLADHFSAGVCRDSGSENGYWGCADELDSVLGFHALGFGPVGGVNRLEILGKKSVGRVNMTIIVKN